MIVVWFYFNRLVIGDFIILLRLRIIVFLLVKDIFKYKIKNFLNYCSFVKIKYMYLKII